MNMNSPEELHAVTVLASLLIVALAFVVCVVERDWPWKGPKS